MDKFCYKCGKELVDGKCINCDNQELSNEQQTNQQQTNQQQVKTKELEWIQEKSKFVAEKTKNMFFEILPILKDPISETKKITSYEKPIIPLSIIGFKAVIVLIMSIILAVNVNNSLYGYKLVSYFGTIILSIIFTAGIDLLEAVLIKVFAGIMNFPTKISSMISVVGTRALYDIILSVIAGIVALFSPSFAFIIICICGSFLQCIEFASFRNIIDGNENKKVYAFCIAKACIALITSIITYIAFRALLSSAVGSFIGGLF